ncbi:hypothetical protein EMGBS4_18660 [Acidimicrobiaceae bacterium]|nr:hypothetical protein EMGBS4_18660 [Acidimicrobiaceae bacterium]
MLKLRKISDLAQWAQRARLAYRAQVCQICDHENLVAGLVHGGRVFVVHPAGCIVDLRGKI